ncbi:PREDICTED: E3 ubiquitin-protein ligase RNF180-like [Poecilia mexicana]|uniref:E3 ubiquitin-protein ligase RNF180-like n=1 Tax=Poecilia mexicana TaxID=48701 RepID=UPI00072EB448|nr:PREDICTED: E3 ubiquitin-protein ligase RNF180-like [Poecilia mexicana]
MSSRMGVSVTGGTSRNRGNESEDPSEGNDSNEGHNQRMRPTTSWLSDADQAGQHLAKPALSGRKARRKTCPEDKQGRRGDRNQERDEERCFRGKDRGQELSRRMETACADQVQDEPRRGTSQSFSSSNSEMQLKTIFEAGDLSDHSERQHKSSRSQAISFTQTTTTNLRSQSGQPAVQSRFAHPPSQDPLSRDLDPFWAEVRTGRPSQYHSNQTQISESEDEEEEDENKDATEEEGCGVIEVTGRAMYSTETPPCIASGERRMSKREKNRIESLRRRQRRRERWRPSQQPESTQSSTETPTTTSSCSSTEDEETLSMRDKEGFICAVCLDVYFSPYMCHPCNHIFCEPCLRTLAKNNPTNTPCPLCRTIITHVFFQKELNQTAKTFFPKEYLSRKQNFQRAPCSKWPLPSCRKLFRIFRGFQRQTTPSGRRQFPHGGGFPLDTIDFEDDSRGWRFDMDMVIIYIYSVNWVIGFFIFCFLCYLFFPSF